MSKKIIILGGYGNTGIKIADLLLKESEVEVILAARNMERLTTSCRELNEKYHTDRVSVVHADASHRDSLLHAFKGSDMVVVASGTAEYVRMVAGAVLEAGIDYLDIHYSTKKLNILFSMEEDIKNRDLCFITEAGFHPGLPAAVIRYGARYFDKMESARVGSVIQQDWRTLEFAPSTQREFVRELMDYQMLVFRNGQWVKGSMWSTKDFIEMDFSMEPGVAPEFGERRCVPMFLEELRLLPGEFPFLKDMGFYMGGFSWFVDLIIFPFVMVVLKLFPERGLNVMSKLMGWSLSRSSKPPFGIVLKLEASGERDHKNRVMDITLFHEDGYWFTAIPVVACLKQYLDGSIRKPGLWTMGNLSEPGRLMNDMEKMGITIREQEKIVN